MATLIGLIHQTLIQFISLFGIFIVGGFILTLLSRWTSNVLAQFVFPRFGLYLFGLIGIPVHELSHAVFCKLFLHDVKKIKWFDAKAKGGAHGSVEHHYSPWNLYHRIGHFFIGLGPTLLGPLILAALFYLLVPASHTLLHFDGANFPSAENAIRSTLIGLTKIIASKATLKSPGFYIFLYLGICISSQTELSNADLKQVGTGVVPIAIALLLGNILAWGLNAHWHEKFLSLASFVCAVATSFFVFAAILSLLNLAICSLIFDFLNRLMGHQPINPFRTTSPTPKKSDS